MEGIYTVYAVIGAIILFCICAYILAKIDEASSLSKSGVDHETLRNRSAEYANNIIKDILDQFYLTNNFKRNYRIHKKAIVANLTSYTYENSSQVLDLPEGQSVPRSYRIQAQGYLAYFMFGYANAERTDKEHLVTLCGKCFEALFLKYTYGVDPDPNREKVLASLFSKYSFCTDIAIFSDDALDIDYFLLDVEKLVNAALKEEKTFHSEESAGSGAQYYRESSKQEPKRQDTSKTAGQRSSSPEAIAEKIIEQAMSAFYIAPDFAGAYSAKRQQILSAISNDKSFCGNRGILMDGILTRAYGYFTYYMCNIGKTMFKSSSNIIDRCGKVFVELLNDEDVTRLCETNLSDKPDMEMFMRCVSKKVASDTTY